MQCGQKEQFTFTFIRRFYPKRLTIAFRLYIFISMCVPWESNPQPFALLTQCSTPEPHRNNLKCKCLIMDLFLTNMQMITSQGVQ